MQDIENDRLCVYVLVSFNDEESNYIAQSVDVAEMHEASRKLRAAFPSLQFEVLSAYVQLPPINNLQLDGEPWEQAGCLTGKVVVGSKLYSSPDDFYACPFERSARTAREGF